MKGGSPLTANVLLRPRFALVPGPITLTLRWIRIVETANDL